MTSYGRGREWRCEGRRRGVDGGRVSWHWVLEDKKAVTARERASVWNGPVQGASLTLRIIGSWGCGGVVTAVEVIELDSSSERSSRGYKRQALSIERRMR